MAVPLGINHMMASCHDSGTSAQLRMIAMHQEPLHRLQQLRDAGCRDPIGPRRLAVRHRLLHIVLEVLHDVTLHASPLTGHAPRDVGSN